MVRIVDGVGDVGEGVGGEDATGGLDEGCLLVSA